jgi:hypothetical protein
MISWNDYCKYNVGYQTYGTAKKISKFWLIGILSFICIITPFTNWLIPIFAKNIQDIKIRW